MNDIANSYVHDRTWRKEDYLLPYGTAVLLTNGMDLI